MNKTYKVIYNRTRCMYQVVSELAKGHTKSETPEMLKSLFNKHSGLTRGIVMAVLSMSLAMPVGVAVQAADTGTSATSGDTPISDTNGATTPNESVTVKDGAVLVGSGAVSVSSSTDTTKNTTTITIDVPTNGKVEANGTGLVTSGTVYTAVNEEQTAREAAVKSVTDKIGTLDANGSYIRKDAPVSSNLSTLDTQVKINTDAINTNKNAITSLENLSNVSDAGKTVIKEQAKKAVKVAAGDRVTVISSGSETGDGTITYTVTANNNGSIASGDTNLVSGGTMYTELRPDSTGTYYYISNANTTAANLIALDTNLKNVIDAIGLDADDTTTSYTSKLNKYFKVNPEVTTSDDGKTKTYAADAAANGTNSVAIGPSAQAGDKSTDATTSTTITGGTSSTAVGDSAKANGNQAVALGYSASVLNPSSGTSTDSTAIGSNATVDSASNAMALGTKATINETATNGLAIGNGAVTGSAKTTATKADNTTVEVAAAGGVNSVAIGTGATNAGNTSIALGGGASVTNDTDGNYQAVVKSDDIAIGTSAKTSASDYSTAIGKSASVSQSTDAVAIGSSATASSSNDALVLGKEAKAASAADSIAMGTSAAANSADVVAIGSSTSATGANSVVIGKSAQTTSEGGNAIGSSSTASGRSTAIGQSATANNFDALAIGNGATANADRSISLGYHAGVGTTEVKGETQTSGSLIAIGTEAGNNVAGMQNIAIGSSAGSDTKSNYNVAIGSSAGYNISYSDDSNNQNGYNVSIGYKANYQDTAANIMNAISIGEKTNAENYAVAVGGEAQATGTNSIALGYKATAADTDSMALGYNSSAANGNIAIGVGSTAPKITMSTAYLTGDAAPSTYISVGKSDNLRRISNVADGSAAQDVVTVHQLTTAYTDLENTIRGIDTTSLNTYSTTAIDSKIADVKSQIANAKTKYFSYSTSTSTLAANADNTGATATAADAMAIGPNANATNTKTLAIGNNVYATGLRSIAIGTADNPTMDSAGTTTTHNTSAEGENSIALGTSTTAQSDNSVAIGTRAQTYTTDTTKGSITGVKAVAIGYSATTAGDTSVAVGNNATVKYASGTAVGTDSLADGTNAVAIGEGSKAYSDNSTAIGQGNSITGNNTYGLGSSNKVSGAWGSVTTSGVSGYNNSVTSVSDANTMNAISGIYITGNSNSLTQNVVNNVVSDITAMGSSNTIDAGAGGTSSHPNTLSQIAIVGSGNTVQGKSSDDSKTNNIKDVTILGYNNKVDANTDTTVDFSNTHILGSNVTAKLGNSVYLGSNAAYIGQTTAASDAITSARTAADAAAEASDAYKAATTDAEKAQIKAQYEAQYLYQLNVQAMEAKGTTAGTQSYSTDETYGDGTSYTYAGSSPAGVVTVGSVGAERRIQNVAAGLVSATSTDAVNGSQLYALTRQIRFGGDNSSFGKTTAADDQNVVARGSNEAISITGGSDAVTPSITDGNTTYTVDTTKLTDNNIAVVADTDKNALHVQLASNLKNLNTAQLGSGSGDSYKETIKLDGTGTNGGQMTLAGADGTVKTTIDTTGLTVANGPKFTSSGIDAASQKINHVTAGSDDADAVNYGQLKNARTLLTKGANTTLSDTVNGDQHTYTVNVDNLAVKANGTGTTVALANGINFKNGTNTTSAVDNNGNVTIDTKNLTLKANGTNKASVSMDGGINFKNGTNTTATVDTDGTVTISATHNKLDSASYTASNPSDSSNKTTLKLKDTDGNETTLNLTDTYTTVSKNTDHTITLKRNDGSESVSISLDDLNGASKEALKTAAAKATTTVVKGTNVDSVSDDTTSADGHHIYTVNVSNLGVKVADGQKKSVALSEGLVFGNGTNTTASVGDNGTITFNVSNDAIKIQAKDAINMSAGSNVKVETASTDGLSKTFTISATHNVLKSATLTPKSNDVSTLTITGNDEDSASVDIKNTHLTVSKDHTAKTVTFTSNDGITPATTLSLSDFGAASTTDMTAAAAKATTEVKAGNNASLGTVETNQTDQHKIYTVNVDNLGLKQNDTTVGAGKGVSLKNGLNFTDGTNTTASVAENGTISYSVSNDAIKAQAKDAVVVAAGDNVSIDTPTDANNVKTYTVKVNDLKLQANGEDKGTRKLAEGINFADGKNTTATVEDGKVIYSLNDTLTGLISMTAKDTAGNQTLVSGSGVTITPAAAGAQSISLTTNGLSMGGQQITNVASGGETESNAANIGDVKRLVQASASGTTETGFNVKGDDATAKKVKLGKQLNVVGRTNDTSKLSDGNIGVVTTDDGQGNATLTVKLNKNINLDSVKAGNTTLDTKGVSNGKMSLTGTGMTITNTDASKQISVTTNGVSMGSQRIQNVANAEVDTDAATLGQVKNARTVVAGGSNVAGVDSSEDKTTHQMTYTVNVDNLSVKANKEAAKSVTLKNGLTFNNGTNTTASVGDNGEVKYDLNSTLTGLTSVTAGNSTLDTNGLTIKDGAATKVEITSGNVTMGGNVIHNVGAGIDPTDAVNKGQLDALQTQVSGGWNLSGTNSEGTAVTAQIGAGKTVTYADGTYTKSVITKDDTTGNATVKVDVTTGTFGSGTGDNAGTVTSTANGLATTQDVANAINSADINVVADNTPDNKTSVKAGETIHFAKDDNLTLTQNGTTFTYGLNPEISISQVTTSDATNGSTVQDAKGITTTDAAGNTYIQNGQGITLTPSDKTKSPVKLTNTGLNNGGNKITGVGKGTDDADAVNVSQLKEVQAQVGSGWQLAGNDGQKVADIGAGKKVSFKTDSQYLTADTKTAGTDAANVTYGLKTKALTAADGKVSAVDTAEDGLATAKNVAETINQTYWTAASGKSGGSQTDETANDADKRISAGDTVTFNAGNNLSLVQNGASFTYGLQADLTGMNTITFTPRNDAEGHPISLVIGKQKDGVSTNEGYYITGLDNTSWNQSNYVKNRAATEAQLADAIKQVTLASQSGGFKLSDGNNKEVSQVLGQAIGVVGDSNITTTAETTTTDTNGHIRIRLNNTLDLTDQGSVTIGSSQVSDGSIVLNNTDTTKKIALNSTAGTASIGGVTVNGAAKTVSGLSNTEWNVEKAAADGYKGSNKAATESQLQTVYNQATKTASKNELHTLAKEGGYTVDDNHQVSMDVVNGKGETKDSIVIKDLAKASEVGTVSDIAKDLQNKNGDTTKPTSVVEAINNLNDKVGDKNYLNVKGEEIANGDSATTAIGKLNNRMNDIYQTAGQHTTVSNTDKNLDIKPNTDDKGKTNYEINLSKQVNLGDVKFDGEKGSIEAKSVKADSFTSGSTVVNNDGVQVGKGTALTSDSLKVGDNTYVDNKGLNANGNAIRNVGDGKDSGDAVNMKQLNDVKSDYKAADTELAEAIQQTDAGLNEVGRAVNRLGNRLNRVGAGAAALAALHPGTYDPNDKWDFSAGIGHYHDANAVAIGAYYHPNDTTILSIGGSMGGGENMVNAGITWKMGRSGHEQRAAQPVVTHPVQAAPAVQQAAPVRPAPVATPAPVVTPAPVTTPVPVKAVVPATPDPAVTTAMTAAPSGDTAALTQILARQTAILEKLAQNQSQAARPTAVAHGDDIFPDVPENHWAYAYVAKLEKAGALKGFKRPAVLKSPMMTRDDFASVLYTAMANGATTNSALNGDDSLNRLAQEFKAELKDVKP
ncbi:ESPR-type extended signal peptide-containing protein [Megasphaera elsdenii]|uniref:ESPR-type extended signal peptide-containing protein n=1 Tax=Megasphaera elsdenii TaxID=907 RepID=UPI0015C7BC4E|nr:ESPR-type extended signal peptide-containing protein [Megasphaera elsdenii]